MKKIVHIMLASPYVPMLGYQENILPKKHRQLGYKTFIISYNKESYGDFLDEGIPVYNLPKNQNLIILDRIPYFGLLRRRFLGLYDKIKEIDPNYIFVHGTYNPEYMDIVRYKKSHPQVRIYADSHVDYYNWPVDTIRRWIIKKVIYRYTSRRLASVCEKVWGVTPWRVKYLNDVLGVPKKKIDLLVMGGDENFIPWDRKEEIENEIRQKYHIPNDAFLIVTGGRIDKTKNIHLLIDAVIQMNNPNVYLLIFGKYFDDMKEYEHIEDNHVINVGWLSSNDVYPLFLASDIGCFPGTHSVLWEQACASGLPCIFKDWEGGFSHVDVGGNCILLSDITSEIIEETLEGILSNPFSLDRMRMVANQQARKAFSYIEIAKKSIELN